MKLKRQHGMVGVELLIVALAIILIALVIYKVRTRQTAAPATSTTTSTEVPAAPTIASVSDLTKAEHVLDQIDPESKTDSAQLEAQLGGF